MSAATTAVVVPPEKAEHIANIFDGLVALGYQLALSADNIRDGIVLKPVFKHQSLQAQEFCPGAGVLVAEGWLRMVIVQNQLKGFIRAYLKAPPAAVKSLLQFPRGKCEKEVTRETPALLAELSGR